MDGRSLLHTGLPTETSNPSSGFALSPNPNKPLEINQSNVDDDNDNNNDDDDNGDSKN